jgi:hypothetical protein
MTFANFAPVARLGNIVARAICRPLMLLMLAMPLGCSPDGDPPAPTRAVFIDAVTKQVVVTAAAVQYPALHPETGQATLMPAMHCPRCVAWRRVPPPDQLNQAGQALTCAKCKQPLQIEGPLPDELPENLASTQP